jgi:hypothetical protein
MRCPVCKAANVEPPQCRRCKADLSLLAALERQRQRLLADVGRCLREGRWRRAAELADHAGWLRRDEQAHRLQAVAHLLAGDFPRAWQCYQSWLKAVRTDGSP